MRKVIIICGPPCSGKSTLAKQLAQSSDTILDRDEISIAMGFGTQRRRPKWANDQAEQVFRLRCAEIAANTDITAYVVRGLPHPGQRQALADYLNAEIRLLDPGIDECVRRAKADSRPTVTHQWIREWYTKAGLLDIGDPHAHHLPRLTVTTTGTYARPPTAQPL